MSHNSKNSIDSINSRFDPVEQLAATLTQFEISLAEINAVMPRLEFMRQRIADELQAVREERERLEIMTEAEAAASLGIKADHLATMRRSRGGSFPHIAFGNKIMYSRRQLVEICEMYSVGGKSLPAKPAYVREIKRAA